MRLDDLWASLFVASSPPAPGLTASSCSCGRGFATRFFRLRLAVTPCVSLRLPSSVPIGSFHPIRFCPCWAHDMRLPAASLPSLETSRRAAGPFHTPLCGSAHEYSSRRLPGGRIRPWKPRSGSYKTRHGAQHRPHSTEKRGNSFSAQRSLRSPRRTLRVAPIRARNHGRQRALQSQERADHAIVFTSPKPRPSLWRPYEDPTRQKPETESRFRFPGIAG